MTTKTEIDEELYTSRLDRLYDRVFKERMIRVLKDWADAFEEQGYKVSGPYDMTGDEYCWHIVVEHDDLPEPVDVSFEIPESRSYGDGLEGINFAIDIVAYGGAIIGGLTPYNYTEQCLVSVMNLHALMERFEIIRTADIGQGVDLVNEWRENTR